MIAIIKYNAGNISSVNNALKRLGYESVITDNHADILNADKVILPGVGEASSAMKYLKDKGLDKTILSLTQPTLGICLGLQLMCKYSEEGSTDCLGIFDSTVKLFPSDNIIPHMGWNNFLEVKSGLMDKIKLSDDVYFVHSYYVHLNEYTIASSNYILPISAAMQKNNFYGTQFHPEKSAKTGEQILKNFCTL